MAREAAVRGLSVLLVDARDVAAGTSSRSSRLVHGGLRYLRNGHFALVREALHERERLLRLAPHLVRPLPMLMPFFDDGGGKPWQLRLGTWLYSRLAGRSTLPRPRRRSADEAVRAFPGLRRQGLRSAIEFFDARTQDARLTLANVLAAVEAGCEFANYVEAVAARGDDLVLLDRIGGDEVRVRYRHVLNAAGPAVDRVRAAFEVGGEPLVRCSRGSHVVLPARAGELALAAFLPDERIQFVIPHAGGTLCGTTDVDDELEGDETGPPVEDLDYLHAALGSLLEPPPERADVQFAYAGWRALPRGKGPPGGLNREAFTVTEPLPHGELHTVVGGKLTTHRSFAERTIARLFSLRDPSPTRALALPGGDGPREVDDPLWWRYGSRVGRLRALLAEQPEWRRPLCRHRPFLLVELVHALRDEGAVTFADVMLRRLVDPRGPCREPHCLQRAYAAFVEHRRFVVEGAADEAIADLQRECDELCGALATWRAAAPSSDGGGA